MKYRLVEENKLRRLIESDMIYNALCECGLENWFNCVNDFSFPDIDDIEVELNKYGRFEERDSDD